MNDMSLTGLAKTETKPLAFVTSFHEVRPVNPAYVEKLRAKIREIGVKPYPLSVTPEGVLYGGRHRYEAFKAEGIGECLMYKTDLPYPEEMAAPDAWGSGAEFAIGAMRAGAGADEAVKIAIACDVNSGGPVTAFSLKIIQRDAA